MMIPILIRPSAVWSWITPAQPSSSATTYEPTDWPLTTQTEAQSASIRQEEEIQELRDRRDELFQRIRQQFTFIYRAEGHAIYNQYEEAKRAVD
ncbi:MAG: hypothetical protein FRX48_08614 [Lasallia pustulata]|uniref:Uncharacterized protein n=1 Tax=Lasallia pustulata TaxID=136370 RepID=A0A5M8PFS4_9LECA|nr:MAG: hypothetical protein FRX48_08614 [Lasallia pustulata]